MPRYKVGDSVWWKGQRGRGEAQLVVILAVTDEAPYLYTFTFDSEHNQQTGKLAEDIPEEALSVPGGIFG